MGSVGWEVENSGGIRLPSGFWDGIFVYEDSYEDSTFPKCTFWKCRIVDCRRKHSLLKHRPSFQNRRYSDFSVDKDVKLSRMKG